MRIQESSAVNNCGIYAVGAARAERNGEWGKAAELWKMSMSYARDTRSRHWASARMAYCENAQVKGWEGVNEREAVQ